MKTGPIITRQGEGGGGAKKAPRGSEGDSALSVTLSRRKFVRRRASDRYRHWPVGGWNKGAPKGGVAMATGITVDAGWVLRPEKRAPNFATLYFPR